MFPETNHYQWVVSGKGEYEEVSGGANGARTRNPLLAKQVRYQLRHSPIRPDQLLQPKVALANV